MLNLIIVLSSIYFRYFVFAYLPKLINFVSATRLNPLTCQCLQKGKLVNFTQHIHTISSHNSLIQQLHSPVDITDLCFISTCTMNNLLSSLSIFIQLQLVSQQFLNFSTNSLCNLNSRSTRHITLRYTL